MSTNPLAPATPAVAGRPSAVISVDVDPVDLHLVGYGHPGLPADSLVYSRALPRLLELFARCGVRATLFCVGRDAASQAGVLGAAARAGHEIASHTWSHPIRFARLPASRHRAELEDSKRALELASGTPVIGFRAPNFDMATRLVPRLAAAGYLYDASAYPSPLLFPARAVLALKSRDRMSVLRMRPWPFTWRREPFRLHAGGAEVMEFPVSVTPGWRFPVYHTLIYYRGMKRLTMDLDGFVKRGELFGYTLHAVDALGRVEDGVDPRLGAHPGMGRPLAEKLELLENALRAIAARFHVATYADLVR